MVLSKEEKIVFFFWGILKWVYSMRITAATHMIDRIKSEYAKADGNIELLPRVHVNFAKHINIFITNV